MTKWMACPTCSELTIDIKKHKCHALLKRKVDEAVDNVVLAEISTFEQDVDAFWQESDVLFFQFLLNQQKEGK